MRRLALVLALSTCAAPAAAQQIFADDFESGNLFRWSESVGEVIAAAEVFRFQDLDLRDPHLWLEVPLAGCVDFTDQPLPFGLGPSFNDQLESALTGDADPADGALDASYLLAFRPFVANATDERLDLQSGSCSAPEATTACVPDPGTVPQTVAYDGVGSGTCLAPVPGTTSGYVPAIVSPVAPGFASDERTLLLGFGDLALPLAGARVAATFADAPVDHFADGLLLGFLRESDADQILLPADLPLVGGQPFSVLLPGGTGNCAAGDDRDLLDGVPGWWFYFAFPARRVPFTE